MRLKRSLIIGYIPVNKAKTIAGDLKGNQSKLMMDEVTYTPNVHFLPNSIKDISIIKLPMNAQDKSRVWIIEPIDKPITHNAEKMPANAMLLLFFILTTRNQVAAHTVTTTVCAKQGVTYITSGAGATVCVSVHI